MIFVNTKLSILILSISIISCDFGHKFNSEFKNHIAKADSGYFDNDILHPTHAYYNKGNLIGIEFDSNPECGNYNRKYIISNGKTIDKVIVRKNFYTQHCEIFDSIYVIEPKTNSIKVYTQNNNESQIINNGLIQRYLIFLKKY